MTTPTQLQPLTPNPGGVVDPEDLIGREDELERLLTGVAHGGAYVVGDRRMGKTSLIRKAKDLLESAGHTVIYVSAELSSVNSFEQELLGAIGRKVPLRDRLGDWEAELTGEAGLKVGETGIKLVGHLKHSDSPKEQDLLTVLTRGIARSRHRFILFIDEISVLASQLHDQKENAADKFLHSLRRTRQSIPEVSIVLAGSVGLHHSVRDLTSLNDLPEVLVGELSSEAAIFLGRRLLLGAFGPQGILPGTPEMLASACSNIPYYIQAVIGLLGQRSVIPPQPQEIAQVVEDSLINNYWHTDHYYDRIYEYYSLEDTEHVIAILDAFTRREAAVSLSLDQLLTETHMNSTPKSMRSRLGEILRTMQRDHYIVASPGGYRISTHFLHRTWQITRERR